MYKNFFTLAAIFSAMTATLSVAQNQDFVDGNKDLFVCDFQDATASYQLVTSYDLANLEPSSFMKNVGFSVGRPWLYKLMDDINSVNSFAGCCSEFATPAAANAWLVTKPIYISGKSCKLSWKSESFNPNKLDGLKVFISTEGGNPETHFSTTPVWESEAEPAGKSELLDGEWNEHELSLDEYAGKTIWIAFVNQTYDGQILCLDDIRVYFDGAYIVSEDMPLMSTNGSAQVKGHLTAKNKAIKKFTVHYQAESGDTDTKVYDNLDIQPGETFHFTFDKAMTLGNAGEFQTFQIWAEVDGEQNAGVTDSIARVNFIPRRKVVLEEGTGTWCGYCPMGILAIEHLEKTYGDQFIPIAVHNNDVMTVSKYDQGLRFANFPIGLVNRTQLCYPMLESGGNYRMDGVGTFVEAVEKAMQQDQLGEIRIKSAELSDGLLNIFAEIEFALTPAQSDYRLIYVVTENDVIIPNAYQSNYLASYTQPIFGEFGSGGKYGQTYLTNYPFQEVAREIYPSFEGRSGEFPHSPEANNKYEYGESIVMSNVAVADSAKLEMVVMLVDGMTGSIVAADKKAVLYTGKGETGIGEITGDALDQRPQFIYDLQGRKREYDATRWEELPSGIYIIDGKKVVK